MGARLKGLGRKQMMQLSVGKQKKGTPKRALRISQKIKMLKS